MKLLRYASIPTCVFLLPVTVDAASSLEAQVDYSADRTMETEGGVTMKSRVYHTANKDRMGGSDR